MQNERYWKSSRGAESFDKGSRAMEREWAQERAAFDKHSEEVARNLADVKARIASLQQVQERAITVADNWIVKGGEKLYQQGGAKLYQ